MVTDPTARGLIDAILTHQDALRSLLSAPKTKRELQNACDVSRSTIDRWIKCLESNRIIHRRKDRYDLTLFGKIITLKFTRLQSQLDQLIEMRDSLTQLSDEIEVAPEVLEAAEIAVYNRLAPELIEDLVGHPGRARLLAPPVSMIFPLVMSHELNPHIECEIMLNDVIYSKFYQYLNDRQLSLAPETEFKLYEIKNSPSFCLALITQEGESIMYIIFELSHTDIGVIKSDAPDAIAWGQSIYHNYYNEATECKQPHANEFYDVLNDPQQRAVLMGVLDETIRDETDAMVRNTDDPSLEDSPLAVLEKKGYIQWDHDSGDISKGPQFEEIKPVLEMVENSSEQLSRYS